MKDLTIMKRKRLSGFTLAEVLITLAIIGVVAALSIPAVISNSQQQEFKTGLRKAVSVLNSAITMNMALDGESPYDNSNLMGYLMKHMSIVRSTKLVDWFSATCSAGVSNCNNNVNRANAVFYTTDGMRFEFHYSHDVISTGSSLTLHERSDVKACSFVYFNENATTNANACGGCGSYGLNDNRDNTTKPPCAILVDVNGDKRPTPGNVKCLDSSCKQSNLYYVPLPGEKKVRDIFTILITDKKAIPYGVTAQKAMYQAQK